MRAPDALEVDPAVLVEALVLDRDHGLLDRLRDRRSESTQDAAAGCRSASRAWSRCGRGRPSSGRCLYCSRFSSAGRSWATDIMIPKTQETSASMMRPRRTSATRSFLSRGRPLRGGGGPGAGERGRAAPRWADRCSAASPRSAPVASVSVPGASSGSADGRSTLPPSRKPRARSRARARTSWKTEVPFPASPARAPLRCLDARAALRCRCRDSRAPGLSPPRSASSRRVRLAVSPAQRVEQILLDLPKTRCHLGVFVCRAKEVAFASMDRRPRSRRSVRGARPVRIQAYAWASLPRRAQPVSLALAR